MVSFWWIHSGYSLVWDFRLLTGLEFLFRWRSYFSSPCCIVSEPVFSSDFYIPFFGQKHFNIKLYSDSYVFIILNRWIFGCPLSFGRSKTTEVSHRWRCDAFNNAVDVMIWWSLIILFPNSDFSFDYWVSSGWSKLLWCPKCFPEGELVVFFFQFLNPSTYSLYDIVVLVGDLTIVLFCFRFCIYSYVVGDSFSWDRSTVPSSSFWEKVVNMFLPTRESRGSTVNGVPSAWLRFFALRSAINWSIKIGPAVVWTSNVIESYHTTKLCRF